MEWVLWWVLILLWNVWDIWDWCKILSSCPRPRLDSLKRRHRLPVGLLRELSIHHNACIYKKRKENHYQPLKVLECLISRQPYSEFAKCYSLGLHKKCQNWNFQMRQSLNKIHLGSPKSIKIEFFFTQTLAKFNFL